jgi:hypothetical protein
MKRELQGKKFQSDQEVKTACSAILLKPAARFQEVGGAL